MPSPTKDDVLQGGQTKEDSKQNEVFWNITLAPDQIDRLLDAKALTHFRKLNAVPIYAPKENTLIEAPPKVIGYQCTEEKGSLN